MNLHQDMYGRDLKIGDIVVTPTTATELGTYEVIKLTNKQVRIRLVWWESTLYPEYNKKGFCRLGRRLCIVDPKFGVFVKLAGGNI